MRDPSVQIMTMPVNKGSVMPVVWELTAVEGDGDGARLHLTGKVIVSLIRDPDPPRTIQLTIPATRVVSAVYFLQPGIKLVSCPAGSDWLAKFREAPKPPQTQSSPPSQPAERKTMMQSIRFTESARQEPAPDYRHQLRSQGQTKPVLPPAERKTMLQSIETVDPNSLEALQFRFGYVADGSNHQAFFVLASDHYTGQVEREILRGQTGSGGSLQILISRSATVAERQQIMAKSQVHATPARARKYHPYVDEFEASPMSEWVSLVPAIMPVPELMEDESYTLIGFVKLEVPPHSIAIQREHEIEMNPVLRSATLHKSLRANTSHSWTMSFLVHGEDINTRLVPLLRQIDRCPFLPIVNVMFLQAGISEVVVESVEISTVPEQPNTLQVNLAGRKFDTGGLGFTMPYGLNFNWPLFKMFTDYLPRFLPIDIPMNERVQIYVPSDEYVVSLLDRFFEAENIGAKLGFAPGSDVGFAEGVRVPPEVMTQPNRGHFALLPLPQDPSAVGRYEVLRVDNPKHFQVLANAVINGTVDGLEARRLSAQPDGNLTISPGVLPRNELERMLINVGKGKGGVSRSTMESVVFCWRYDSIGKVDTAQMDSTLSRLLSASFSGQQRPSRSKQHPPSQGAPRAFDSPQMVPFLPDDLNIVWHSVSAGFSNTIAALKRDVGDPIMQYLGKSDITLVLHGMADAQAVSVLRSLFDRYIAVTYLLRGISLIHPVRIHFRIDNEIARLMGLEEAVPVSLEVQNVEGHPDQYQVTMTFVSMDPGGVQRRAMRRLSDNVTRDERMFSLTYSGIDASRELDRFYASLRRSELYPDLRLPTYGLLLEWCRALAFDQHPMRDFALYCLRGLAPGLTEAQFRRYADDVARAMRAFLDDIYRSGLWHRMASTPYLFADPDFYFRDGDGLGANMRRSIRQALSRGGESRISWVDDQGVSASFRFGNGTWDVTTHQSRQELVDFVRSASQETLVNHPYLSTRSSLLDEQAQMVASQMVDTISERSGVSDDPVAAAAKDHSAAYKELSDRFRDAFAIATSDLTLSYTHDVRDDSLAQRLVQIEQDRIDGLYVAVQGLRAAFQGASEVDTTPAVAKGDVVDGVRTIIDTAVDVLVEQVNKPPLDKTFKLTNAATLKDAPGTFSVMWKPAAWGLTVRVIRLVAPILKPFMMGMINQESQFDPMADSGYAKGIAQFTPSTWSGLLNSGRYAIYLVRGGPNSSPAINYYRWDVATLMGLYYLLELVVEGVRNVVGKEHQLRADFAEYFYFDQPSKKSAAIADPTKVLTEPPGGAVAERLLVLGACLYNAGPGALRTILSQLAANVRAGKRGPGMFSISRTNAGHGTKVYNYFRAWRGKMGEGAKPVQQRVSESVPQEVLKQAQQAPISPWISQDTHRLYEVQKRYQPSRFVQNAEEQPNNAGDPFEQFHTLRNFPLLPMTGWSDMCKHQPHGRLLQCFPTYCLILVQGGRWVRWHRFWDHFYGLFSVMSIDVHKSRESPQHTAEIILSNSYRQLSNLSVTQAYAQAAIAGMRPFQQVQGEELMRGASGNEAMDFLNQLVKSVQNSLFPILGDYERHVWNQEMKALFLHPGERIHLRMGYGADAAWLPVVFNGTIASVDIQSSVIRLLALGDGRELTREIATEGQPYKNSNLFGQTVEVRNILIDMLVRRRAESIPVVGPMIYTFSLGGLMNDSAFGIESFGRVEALGGSSAWQDIAAGNLSLHSLKVLGALSLQAGEGELGVNIYNSQRDSNNFSIGMLPLLDTLTLGLSQIARNGDFIAIELKEGTVWDVFRNCQLAVLDALMSVEPFGLRSTLFFGRGYQAFHYEYYDAQQLRALGVPNIASRIAAGGYWRIMKFKQYRQYHLAISEWNLISNEITASSERMWNEVQTFDAQGVPGNRVTFDPAIVPEERKPFSFHSALSTTLMSQLSVGAESNWVSVLARIGIIRNLIGQRLGLAMPIRAVNNVSANLVREGVSLMYEGSLVLAGAAEIKPHDFIFIEDQLRAMDGTIIVREVEHHFSTQHGYTTLVVPDACVLGNGDLDTMNLMQASQMARNMALQFRLRREMILLYRSYLLVVLGTFSFAFSRALAFIGRAPIIRILVGRIMPTITMTQLSAVLVLMPKWDEVLDVLENAWNQARGLGEELYKGILHGAWTKESLKNLLFDTIDDTLDLLKSIGTLNGTGAFQSFSSILSRLASLGAVRPVLQARNLISTTARAIASRTNLLLLVGNTVLEMVNRKLSSYYPCRLYPLRVNGLPLTAGIRGHFGTVEGDDPSPLQRVLDAVTLQGAYDPSKFPPGLNLLGTLFKALYPLHRTVPATPELDEEMENARQQFERRSRYDIMGMFGSIAENFGESSPTMRMGSDQVVQREKPFVRSNVVYSKGDDPSKGDHLLDQMNPQAAQILRELLNELRRRGVPVGIHQGRRTLEQQMRLYQQLQQGRRSKAVAKPTPNAPHVAGRAIDVQYRYPNGTYRGTPPPHYEPIILDVVRDLNVKYAPARIRWLGDRSKYKGSIYEPWHFDVTLPGG